MPGPTVNTRNKWVFVAKTGHRSTVFRSTYKLALAAAIKDLEQRVTVDKSPANGDWDLDLVETFPPELKHEVIR